jgi:hypothetical protein
MDVEYNKGKLKGERGGLNTLCVKQEKVEESKTVISLLQS